MVLARWIRRLADKIIPLADWSVRSYHSTGADSVVDATVTVFRWWLRIIAWLFLVFIILLILLLCWAAWDDVSEKRQAIAQHRLELAHVPTREKLEQEIALLRKESMTGVEHQLAFPGLKAKISWTPEGDAKVDITAPPERVCLVAAAALRGKRPCSLVSADVGREKSTLFFRLNSESK